MRGRAVTSSESQELPSRRPWCQLPALEQRPADHPTLAANSQWTRGFRRGPTVWWPVGRRRADVPFRSPANGRWCPSCASGRRRACQIGRAGVGLRHALRQPLLDQHGERARQSGGHDRLHAVPLQRHARGYARCRDADLGARRSAVSLAVCSTWGAAPCFSRKPFRWSIAWLIVPFPRCHALDRPSPRARGAPILSPRDRSRRRLNVRRARRRPSLAPSCESAPRTPFRGLR